MSCKAFHIVEVTFNNILRRIWRLPARTHTAILHSVAGLQSMYNVAAQRSKSPLLLITAPLTLFNLYLVTLSPLAILFLGSTLCIGSRYLKSYADQDLICANIIRNVRITGSYHLEDDITRIACN